MIGANMYGNPESSLLTDVGQARAASMMGWANVGMSVVGLGMNIIGGALQASAARQQARAQMSALTQSWMWNRDVLRQNKIDTYASNILQSYGAGIKGTTGSTAAVIQSNQDVLERNIAFQEQQYQTEMKNLKAQSKQKYLGIF